MLKVKGVAQTPSERTIGLGNQPKLQKGEAFLLSFDSPQMISIWNKGVDYPIDVGFVNEQGELFQTEQLPSDNPEGQNPLVFSRAPATLVIETPKGELQGKYGLGTKVDQIIGDEYREPEDTPMEKKEREIRKEREEFDKQKKEGSSSKNS